MLFFVNVCALSRRNSAEVSSWQLISLVPCIARDKLKTIKSESRAELKIQASRFIASALPVTTKTEAEQFIACIGKEFLNATHNRFAYRVGIEGKKFRFSDDSEPSGSVGKRITSRQSVAASFVQVRLRLPLNTPLPQ
jgi:hypothetical protein